MEYTGKFYDNWDKRRYDIAAVETTHLVGEEAFGFHWLPGEPWGVAHPRAACYADSSACIVESQRMRMGIRLKQATFEGRHYNWAVGKVYCTETLKYGTLEVVFRLPVGRHLLPAIWMYDINNWPPEIDLMEGYTATGWWPYNRRPLYTCRPWMNHINPGLHFGTADQEEGIGGGLNGRGTWRHIIDPHSTNRCRLEWTPEMIEVRYNGHPVMRVTDGEVLRHYNECNGMHIIINNYVTDRFSYDDYTSLLRHDLEIFDISYRRLQ